MQNWPHTEAKRLVISHEFMGSLNTPEKRTKFIDDLKELVAAMEDFEKLPEEITNEQQKIKVQESLDRLKQLIEEKFS